MDNMRVLIRRMMIYLLVLVGGAMSLRDLKITVPAVVRSGDAVWLTCEFDLQGKLLYTVKWYLDDAEFYRYAPKRKPPGLALPVKNIRVDLTRSTMNDVMLLNVSRNQSGPYKCEASEELPTLETRAQQAHMMVVDVPETDPTIQAERHRLPSVDILRANCTSGASFPAPNITWTLNGKPLDSKRMDFKLEPRKIAIQEEKIMTRSSLELKILPGLFQDSRIRLRCFANILPPVYQATAELEITEDVPFIASITGDASPHSHRTNESSRLSLSHFTMTVFLALILAVTFR
ncbi:uncharacterized protein LOC117167539 isoform X2 [Belonocnema kinseyi]|uniref:uncharacterized protein LOC117167539 isoform X2 n=1 Tax=Belonocnema kinseyi TaxID=2817044 RepID=UPI00143D839B|nr:uncharacterized protein LOC117167539 isoform X2 [Belonocnema kinseyi]XP_033208435.1 uncharacterized protein LOC117167539 isoform X2 [Belonocnema kinseyi]XP_033208436.1 uncharacterized protein LOC117167539 isoform X2 [Belonocnema kinseyi]XP_033208437.1 uncharacterized protein LOC117167539 isoform X2 [Belonocnema kinseyi]XP_033208438.1 uncharacterized protein LOC117167539 isoform X2 [Belonocnema kinseyi]XP_033208439.1 uncharacterized protein LOC117167539 isoform X2 [Belonocnema kinseyi]